MVELVHRVNAAVRVLETFDGAELTDAVRVGRRLIRRQVVSPRGLGTLERAYRITVSGA